MSAPPDVELEELPAHPDSREDYERWHAWVQSRSRARRIEALRLRLEDAPSAAASQRLAVLWRAVIGYWAEERSVAPDDAPLIMHHFLAHALEAPPFVMLAARRLTQMSVQQGATSTDVLFLGAAFAWPLRDVDAELGDLCWRYIVHAPWQTDALNLKDLILAVDAHQAFGDGRGFLDLVEARLEAGLVASAQRLLEAGALVQARREHLDGLTSYRDFVPAPMFQGANRAIVRLARLYQEREEDQVFAREVLKRAAELTRSRPLVDYIEGRVWDRPLEEAYAWSEGLEHPRQLDEAIERALQVGQPHHARRLAEAVMIRAFHRPWYGAAIEHVPVALERFERQLLKATPQDMLGRRAAEHLATLYVRTYHVTQSARRFVHAVAGSIPFCGKGAALHPIREELEWFYNRSDPYQVMRRDEARISRAHEVLSEDEQAASDEVARWFSGRFRPEHPSTIERLAALITAPLIDAARVAGELPLIEQACAAAFQLMAERGHELAGDLSAIARQAARIRSEYGHGMKLIEYARQVTSFEPKAAAALAMATSFLPPGLSLGAHAADLGASLLLAFRAVARVGAVFGRDVHEQGGFRLVADSFALGLSSADGEGLLTYLARGDEQLTRAVTIGGVTYAGSRLVEYMWVAPRVEGPRLSDQLVRHLARICGFELRHTAIARIVPVVGALISGVSTYTFLRMITEAAIHVAARDALLVRVSE